MASEPLQPLSDGGTTRGILPWVPGLVSEGLALLFCIFYAVFGGTSAVMYLQVPVSALLPFAVPICNLFLKEPLPNVLSASYAVFVFGASDLGSACGFYDRISFWDLIMHGMFGFLCCLTIFVFLLRWSGGRLNPVGAMILVFVFTMGIAALWEVWEYLADSITGGDSQRVEESIALGKSPVADTMEDIIVAMAGCVLFDLALFFDGRRGYPLFSRLFGFRGFLPVEKEIFAGKPGRLKETGEEDAHLPKCGRYRHFKGKEYEVIGTARHSETLETMVVYRALYGEGGVWVRPLSSWDSPAVLSGQEVERFTYLDDTKTPDAKGTSSEKGEDKTE